MAYQLVDPGKRPAILLFRQPFSKHCYHWLFRDHSVFNPIIDRSGPLSIHQQHFFWQSAGFQKKNSLYSSLGGLSYPHYGSKFYLSQWNIDQIRLSPLFIRCPRNRRLYFHPANGSYTGNICIHGLSSPPGLPEKSSRSLFLHRKDQFKLA